MTLAELLQVLHVASAFWFVAGLIGRNVVLGRARRSDDISRVRTLVEVAGPFDRFMVTYGSIAVFFLGILTMWAQHLPLWENGTRWAVVALVAFATLIPIVPLVFLPRGHVFEAALADAIRVGRVTPELSTAFHDPVTATARWYELAVVAFVIYLMVAKPF
ncbi:MAG TPA: DUF2269 family protein [Actinomycetota bacterium]|jgi:hypothetical protein|nr:DUF2269 family protein [Actinomycetota bacterium]